MLKRNKAVVTRRCSAIDGEPQYTDPPPPTPGHLSRGERQQFASKPSIKKTFVAACSGRMGCKGAYILYE